MNMSQFQLSHKESLLSCASIDCGSDFKNLDLKVIIQKVLIVASDIDLMARWNGRLSSPHHRPINRRTLRDSAWIREATANIKHTQLRNPHAQDPLGLAWKTGIRVPFNRALPVISTASKDKCAALTAFYKLEHLISPAAFPNKIWVFRFFHHLLRQKSFQGPGNIENHQHMGEGDFNDRVICVTCLWILCLRRWWWNVTFLTWWSSNLTTH